MAPSPRLPRHPAWSDPSAVVPYHKEIDMPRLATLLISVILFVTPLLVAPAPGAAQPTAQRGPVELETGRLPGAIETGLGTASLDAPLSVKDRYIVVLKDSVPDPLAVALEAVQANAVRSGSGVASEVVPTYVYRYVFKGFAAKMSARVAESLRRDRRVTAVVPSHIVEADQTLPSTGAPTGVRRIGADRSTYADIDRVDGSVDVDVAVLDGGVDPNHADFNVVRNADCARSRSLFDGGHGTHVAGTIGALDDGQGVVGVAPGARIWSVKVLGGTRDF